MSDLFEYWPGLETNSLESNPRGTDMEEAYSHQTAEDLDDA